jgi:hypothetical protein
MCVKRRHGWIWDFIAALSGRTEKITQNISHGSRASWPMFDRGAYCIRSKTANHSTMIFNLERLTPRKSKITHSSYSSYPTNQTIQPPSDQTTSDWAYSRTLRLSCRIYTNILNGPMNHSTLKFRMTGGRATIAANPICRECGSSCSNLMFCS